MVYIGRAVGLGRSPGTNPVALYAVSGRSEESRARIATINDNKIHIGPIDGSDNDPLRHYDAMTLVDWNSIVVSNGVHINCIAETYEKIKRPEDAIKNVLAEFGAEPDSYHTPRIAALFNFVEHFKGYFGIVNKGHYPSTWYKTMEVGTAFMLPTYTGDQQDRQKIVVNNYNHMFPVKLHGNTPEELAEELYGIIDRDFVVCTSAAVWDYKSQEWKFAVRNLHG